MEVGQRTDVRGRTVILVDDGIATGSTIRAAVQALRHLQVGHLVVAVPTAAWSSARALRPEVDELINVMTPKDLAGVGEWYEDFSQTTDRKVHELLKNTRPFPIPT